MANGVKLQKYGDVNHYLSNRGKPREKIDYLSLKKN